MKTIYTSNYARHSANPNAAAISYSTPQWYEGVHLAHLAPSWDLVSGYKYRNLSPHDYTIQYIALLESRDITPDDVWNNIADNTILLCYESPSEFCHRLILADWVYDGTGHQIIEWKNEKEMQAEKQRGFVDSAVEF